jgi:hypothetical protein
MRSRLADLLRAIAIPLVAAIVTTMLASVAHLATPTFIFDLWVESGLVRAVQYFVCLMLSSHAGWLVVSRRVGSWAVAGFSGVVVLALAQVLGRGSVQIGLLLAQNGTPILPLPNHEFTTIPLLILVFTLPAFVSGALGGALRQLIGFGQTRVA